MIQKARKRVNVHGVNLYKSQASGHKIVGVSVSKSDSNSTTISKKPIIEIDENVLPDDADLNKTRDTLIDQAKVGNLTQAEIETLISMIFRYKTKEYKPGQFFYDETSETIYEVKQEHQSSTDTPATRSDLYKPLISMGEINKDKL
jgi:hypothetical protein